jgi:predicted transcriptional regulator
MYILSNLSNNKNGDFMLEAIMSKDIISIKEESSIKEAASKMLAYDVGFLPITHKNKIVGVITDRDIATTVFKNTTTLDTPVKDYMHKHIIFCDKKKDVLDALQVMRKEKIKRILVTDKKKVIGILSLSDILNNCDFYEEILKTLKEIFTVGRNTDTYKTEIDEFYL